MGTSFFIRDGETIADWTIADSGGHADTLYISDPTLSFGPWLTQGLMGAFAKNCPGCSVSELTTNPSQIGAALPGMIVSYLQAHPGVKYVDAEYSALLTGLPALAARAPADATLVVYHSAVLAYVAPEDRQQFAAVVRGLRAVWLSNEAPGVVPGVPVPPHQGAPFVLARDGRAPLALADGHGTWLQWLQ